MIPDTHNRKEERFTLAHGIRGFSPRLAGSTAEIWWKGVAKMLGSWLLRRRAGNSARKSGTRDHTAPEVMSP